MRPSRGMQPHCGGCGKYYVAEGEYLCAQCKQDLGTTDLPPCPDCGAQPLQIWWDGRCGLHTKLMPEDRNG